MVQALLCPKCGETFSGALPGEICPACQLPAGDDDDRTLPPLPPTTGFKTLASAAPSGANVAPSLDPIRIPGYEILGDLGRGGMGVVYKARHLDLKRLVALKMIVAADYATPDQLERFRHEAEAVARLQHPNIVQIYEVGQRDGRPYFSLEFVDGGSLADKLRGTPLPPAEAAHVLETLARAVHAAHQRGIVHRDLKPANVLLTLEGTPKIADFGLAKETEGGSSRTQEGTVVGTPSYMAPEQASGAITTVGPAADTYALGAILYETLTGRPPFKGVTSLDTILQVVTLEPTPPRDLQPQVPRDLETICLKCLHKDPARRYASALDLAEDLHRFQAHEPIQARPTSALERLGKWAWRYPAAAGLIAALAVLFVTAFAMVTWRWQEADRAAVQDRKDKEHAETDKENAERIAKLNQKDKEKAESLAKLDREAKEQFERLAKLDRQDKEKADKLAKEANKRAEAEERAAREATKRAEAERQGREEVAAALEKSEQNLFTSQIWRAAGLIDNDPVKALQTLEDKLRCPPVRRDFAWRYQYQLGQRLVRRLAQQKWGIWDGALSPDGKTLATITFNDKVRLWDFATGAPGLLLDADHGGGNPNYIEMGDGVHLVFSPDSKTLATAWGPNGLVKLWDVKTGTLKTTLKWQIPDGRPRMVETLAFHPDGKTLAVGGHFYDRAMHLKNLSLRFRFFVVWVWDLDSGTGKLLTSHARFKDVVVPGTELGVRVIPENSGVNSLVYSPDGKSLAVGLTAGSVVLLLDSVTGEPRQRLHKEAGFIQGMGFSADGRQFVYGNTTNNIFLCDLVEGKVRRTLHGHMDLWQRAPGTPGRSSYYGISDCKFTADGSPVTSGHDGNIRIWDAGTGQMRTLLRCGDAVLSFFLVPSKDDAGQEDLVAITSREVQVWSMRTLAPAVTLNFRFKRPPTATSVSTLAFDESSTRLAVVGPDDQVSLYRVTRKLVSPVQPQGEEGKAAETSPSWFASISAKPDGKLRGHTGRATAVAFGPAGSNLVVSGGIDKQILVWRVDDDKQELLKTLSGHTRSVTHLAVTPDGKFIVSASLDGTLRLWDVESAQSSQPFDNDNVGFTSFALSKDGKRLVTCDKSGRLRVWDFEKRRPVQTVSVSSHAIDEMSLTPDGKLAAAVSRGVFSVHDLTTGLRYFGDKKDDKLASFGFLGVVLENANGAVKIKQLMPAGPAQQAGLKVDDIVIAAGADKIVDIESLQKSVQKSNPGDVVTFKVVRGKETLNIKTILGVAPVLPPLFADGTKEDDVMALLPGGNRRNVMALTPDGKSLAVTGGDRVVRLYDVASGHLRCELPVLSHNVFGLGFNHDGTLLATVSLGQQPWDDAGEVKLWAAAPPAQTK